MWVVGSSSVYSTAFSYKWLISRARNENNILSWKWIWHLKAPFKISFLVWFAVHDSLPTNVLNVQRGLSQSSFSPRCGLLPESTDHCLKDCEMASDLWIFLVLAWILLFMI